jgi:hypothetical protein
MALYAPPTSTDPFMSKTIRVNGVSNREFLERYAGPGRVGLSGGTTLVDKAICRAERHLDPNHRWSVWSHAFLFEGERLDGHHWVIESDLQIQRKHLQFGVQENRVSKYFDQQMYASLAVLDFGLAPAQTAAVLGAGLEWVASRGRYSIRELLGTLLALHREELREKENLLARDRSVFCSAFVRHVFSQAGLDLARGVDVKNTTPQDIFATDLPHTVYILQREVAHSTIGRAVRRVRAGVRQLKRKRGVVRSLEG